MTFDPNKYGAKPVATSTASFDPSKYGAKPVQKSTEVPTAPQEPQQGFLKSLAMGTGIPRLASNVIRGWQKTADIAGMLKEGPKGDWQKYANKTDVAKPVQMPWLGAVKPVGQEGSFTDRLKDSVGEGAKFASTVVPVTGGATSVVRATLAGRVRQGLKAGAGAGAFGGGLYGAGEGIQEEDATLGSVAGKTALGAGIGAVGGGVVGGVLPLAGAGVRSAQQKIAPTYTQGVQQIKKGYDDLFGLTKTGMKNVEKSARYGKDPSLFLANKGLVPEVTPDGKLDTIKVRQKLSTEAEELDDTLTSALKETGIMVRLDDVREKAVSAVDNAQTRADSSLVARQQEVNKIFDTYKEIYGDSIPLDVLNEIKRGQYRLTKSFDATKPAFFKDVNYKIANSAKEIIETSAKGLNIKEFNRYYGDLLDASSSLEKIHGNAVKGGRLGRYFAETGGTLAGATVGSLVGGLPGGILGGLAGKTVSGAIQKRSMQGVVATKSAQKAVEKGGAIVAPFLKKP